MENQLIKNPVDSQGENKVETVTVKVKGIVANIAAKHQNAAKIEANRVLRTALWQIKTAAEIAFKTSADQKDQDNANQIVSLAIAKLETKANVKAETKARAEAPKATKKAMPKAASAKIETTRAAVKKTAIVAKVVKSTFDFAEMEKRVAEYARLRKLIEGKTTVKGLILASLAVEDSKVLSKIEKQTLKDLAKHREDKEILPAIMTKVEAKVAPKAKAEAKVIRKPEFPKASAERKLEKKARVKAQEAKAKADAKDKADAKNGKAGVNARDWFLGTKKDGYIFCWVKGDKNPRTEIFIENVPATVVLKTKPSKTKFKFKPEHVKKEVKTKRLKFKKIVEQAREEFKLANPNSYSISFHEEFDSFVRMVYLFERSVDSNIKTDVYWVQSLEQMIDELKTDNLVGLQTLVENALVQQGETQEEAEIKANDLLYYLLHDGILLNRDLTPVKEMKSGSSASANQTQKPQKPQQSEKENMKAEKLKELIDLFNEVLNSKGKVTKAQKDAFGTLLPFEILPKSKQLFLQKLEERIEKMRLTRNLDQTENLKEILKNKNLFLENKGETKKARQKGYALVPQVEFKRNDSAGTLSSQYGDDSQAQAAQNGYTLIFKVTGEYNSAGNMLAQLAGVETELGDVLKVVAPENATSDDKKFIVSAMVKAGYHPIVDGTYLLAGSEVHTYFTSLVSCVFSESDAQTSAVGALSYARSFISASALKKFNCPVIIANDGDGFVKGNAILEGNDGAMTHNGLGSKLAFQMRGLLLSSTNSSLSSVLKGLSWSNPSNGKLTLVKGLSTYCKVGFVKDQKKFVLLEDYSGWKNTTCGGLGFKFEENQVWEQTLVNDAGTQVTITVGLFINASVVKGAGKKDSVKFGEVYSFEDFLGWVIAEDNPLIAMTKWSWQHVLNMSPWKLVDSDRIFELMKKQFENYFSKKIKTEFDLLAGLNPKNVEFLNKNGPFKSQTVYVQMSNVGQNVAFAKFDLFRHQKGMEKAEEKAFLKQFGTVRTPIQSAGDYHVGNCYNITKVLNLFASIKGELNKFKTDESKKVGSAERQELTDFVNGLTDSQKTFLEDFSGTQESFSPDFVNIADFAKLEKDFNDSWFALKGFIAPAVANGCLWLDSDDQKKVNGDNDGDRNEIIFDTELLELLKLQHYKIVESDGSLSAMEKRETEVDKKEVANFTIGDGAFELNQIKTNDVDSNLKSYFEFICASGNSPNQGNVGGISMAPAALEAHVKYYRNDNTYTTCGFKLKAKANLFNNGQTLIDWQKRLLHLPSLLQWHLLNDKCKEVHADDTFVICGQEKLNTFGSREVARDKGKNARIELLKQKSSKENWVEKLPSMTMADTLVEITDYDQGYSTPGIYLYTAWLVNAMNIAEVLAPDTGDGLEYGDKLVEIWSDWLVNDFREIPEAITRPTDESLTKEERKKEKIKNIQDKLVTLYGDSLKDFVWVFSNELTSWMEDSILGGSTKCPPQFDSLRKTGKIAFHSFVRKNFAQWYHVNSSNEDGGIITTNKLAAKVLDDNASELNSLLDSHKALVPSVTQEATWDAFILNLMHGFKGALKEKLASTSTSMKYTTDLTQSGADSLSLLYKAIGNVDADDQTEIGKLMFALKSVLVNSNMETTKRRVTLNWLKLNLRNIFAHDIKEIYGMQKQKDLSEDQKTKLELLAEKTLFIKDNFLEAIEESLENAERHNLAMQHVNDAMLKLVKTDLKAVKDLSDFAEFKKAIIAAETKAQGDLRAVLFKQSLEGKTIEIPVNITDDADKTAFVEKEQTRIWLRSYENRTLSASLGVFRNAYRAVEFYEDAGLEVAQMKKILADTLIEKIKDESGNKTVEMMRTAIKFEVPEDLEVEIISNIVDSRENITWLTKQIVGVKNSNITDADYGLEDLFIFKNGYTYVSGQMLALLKLSGVKFDLKAWLTFTKRLGGGMVYTRATNEILNAILDKAPGKTGFTDEAILSIKNLRAAIHGINLSLTAKRLDDNNEAVDFGIFWSPDYLTVDRMAWYKANPDQWSFKRELRKFLHQSYNIELYKPSTGEETEMNRFWGPVQPIMTRLGLSVIGGSSKNSTRSKGIEALNIDVNNIFEHSTAPKALSVGKQAELQPMPKHVTEMLTHYFAKNGDEVSLYSIAEAVVKDLGEIDLPTVLSFFGLRSRMSEWLKAGLNAEKGTLDYNLLKGAIARTNVYSVRQALGFLLEERDQIGGLVQDSIKFNTACVDTNTVLNLLGISADMK